MGTHTANFSEYLGVVNRPHGLDGSFTLTDVVSVPTRIATGSAVGIGFSREFLTFYTLADFKQSPNRITMRLHGVTSKEAVLQLVDQAVYFSDTDLLNEQDERYSIADILGCDVRHITDEQLLFPLGVVSDVLLLPANDVWVVTTPQGNEVLIPVINDVIVSVDTTNKLITVKLLDGLVNPESEDE